jgi:hypothetical protein
MLLYTSIIAKLSHRGLFSLQMPLVANSLHSDFSSACPLPFDNSSHRDLFPSATLPIYDSTYLELFLFRTLPI